MLVAIVLAAGASTRAGENKALADIGGRPMVRWAADALAADSRVSRLLVVERKGAHEIGEAVRGVAKPYAVWPGGETRADSVRSALRASVGADVVLVHDAARPFVDGATIARVIDGQQRHGAAAAALTIADTIRRGEDEWAGDTLERDGVWAMQTPQAFRREDLVRGYDAADTATDCTAAALAAGIRVRLVRGNPLNFKVTSPEDLELARALARAGVVGR
ncbi:MAG: 2-C-methyl-D-erythritol 4-phosphate cytidylyltransferase [Chloroflexi bacterium 13_1_40CM_4_68_4]|nr:MAG: 2-C-methyl-D-erythritol 4-phosphate cytidylyltransferase [Chloroflexi bacterium 13_1_40CM_4_68_4]